MDELAARLKISARRSRVIFGRGSCYTLGQLSPVERSVFPDLRRSAGPLRDVDGRCSHQLLPVGGGCRLNAHYVVVTREVVSASRLMF